MTFDDSLDAGNPWRDWLRQMEKGAYQREQEKEWERMRAEGESILEAERSKPSPAEAEAQRRFDEVRRFDEQQARRRAEGARRSSFLAALIVAFVLAGIGAAGLLQIGLAASSYGFVLAWGAAMAGGAVARYRR